MFCFCLSCYHNVLVIRKNRQRSLSAAATINGKLLAGARLGIGPLNVLKGLTLMLPVCRDQRPTVRPRPGLSERPGSIPIITVYVMDVVGAIAILYMAFSNY